MLFEIRPKSPARVLGGVRMPSIGMVWPHPPWHYHFAVLFDGRLYDEAYPAGLPMQEYKNRFEHQDYIMFIEHHA